MSFDMLIKDIKPGIVIGFYPRNKLIDCFVVLSVKFSPGLIEIHSFGMDGVFHNGGLGFRSEEEELELPYAEIT
jgi:hypothetical protein